MDYHRLMSKIRNTPVVAALIGSGFMGGVHTRALRAAGVQIAGLLSSTPARTRKAASELGIDRAYETVEELMSDSTVTLVHVLTPNHNHAELARLALDAGKHVVCEKPLATSAGLASDLAGHATKLGLVGAVPFVYRYHPMVREAKSRFDSGRVGRLLSIKGEYLQDWLLDPRDTNWRVSAQEGGFSRAFADIGVHLCDLVEFISGQRIVRLVSSAQTVFPERAGVPVRTEDTVMVIAKLESGAMANLMVSQVAAGHKNALMVEFHGSAETIRFEQENPEKLWIGQKQESKTLTRDPDSLSVEAKRISRLPAGHPEGYFDAFVSFMRDVEQAITDVAPNGIPTFVDGARAAVLTEAVLLSASQETWVDVPPASTQ
jgi:predicted dehydrogenase